MENVKGNISSGEINQASAKMAAGAWSPEDYSKKYYQTEQVDPDEQAAAEFEIEFLRRQSGPLSRGLDYGCGPTLQRAIAAATYVSALDMADYDPNNLEAIQKWVDTGTGDEIWGQYTECILACEGISKPSREQVASREKRTREVISRYFVSDATTDHPLGSESIAFYDLLISAYCLECISPDKELWQRAMNNVFSVLKPEGCFFLLAMWGASGYEADGKLFPVTKITKDDLRTALLKSGASADSLIIKEHVIPNLKQFEGNGILMSCGYKT